MKSSHALLLIATVATLGTCSNEREVPSDTPAKSNDTLATNRHLEGRNPNSDAQESLALPQPALHYGAREGKALFLHFCATCHGEKGQGDGFNAYNLDPSPRDLSEPAFQEARSDEELFELIRLGGAAAGLSNAMPPWGNTINDRGIHHLITYLHELRVAPIVTGAGEE